MSPPPPPPPSPAAGAALSPPPPPPSPASALSPRASPPSPRASPPSAADFASPRTAALRSSATVSVAAKWDAVRSSHAAHELAARQSVRNELAADLEQHELAARGGVSERVKYFNSLLNRAITAALADVDTLAETDREKAGAARLERRLALEVVAAEDAAARRAPRPTVENVAGCPEELVIQLFSPALNDPGRGDHLLYALVDVSRLEDVSARCDKWTRYEKPLRITKAGKYAVLTKMIPGDRQFSSNEIFADDTSEAALFARCDRESAVVTAVYELSVSPPWMQYEGCDVELAFVPTVSALGRHLVCGTCGQGATAERKLYAAGEYVVCRACALSGAGVLVDAGARRMWFSQMITFVGNRAIPLPASQALLTQILRVLQAHAGLSVRFEGHVNSNCGLDCAGAGACGAAGAMCQKCPGGAVGLSTARAHAVRAFVLACGIESDRLYAQGFAGTRRLTDTIDEATGHVNRRVEVHTLLS
ncbi:hypothetical protein M885DRAFT_523171 [Pelagophyceae sp. CCMP2097]|nr:hypothetical protein M885DRAFT_523171 [Pelagophyceae sp. CCMP2097]